MNRWKNVCGRIALELLFGDLVTWKDDLGQVSISALARRIHVRPVRLVEYMEELKLLGYFTHINIQYKTIEFKFRKVGALQLKADASPLRWKPRG